MNMSFTCRRTVAAEGLVALQLIGELDIETVSILTSAIDRVVEEGAVTLVLDLAGLAFLDSTGIHAILETDERLKARGAQLVLTHGKRSVQSVFTITGLDTQLKFIDTLGQLMGPDPGKGPA